MAVESNQALKPVVLVHFITIINIPWRLMDPIASGGAITGNHNFTLVRSDTCDQFTDLDSILQAPVLYCQEWILKFDGDTHCTSTPRNVQVSYTAKEPQGRTNALSMSWVFDLGTSAAFECAHNLGEFQIALQLEGASGGNKNFASPGKAFLDDWYFFKITASSGAPVTAVTMEKLDIEGQNGKSICSACNATKPELKLRISDWSPDNFVIAIFLDKSLFHGHLFATMSFTFEVSMDVNTVRRRLMDSQQSIDQRVTLTLAPSEGRTTATDPPNLPNPYATPDSQDDVWIEVVEVAKTPQDLSSAGEETGSSMSWVWILLGVVATLALGYAAYEIKNRKFQIAEKRLEMDEPVSPSLGGAAYSPSACSPSFSIQNILRPADVPEPYEALE